MTEDEKYGIWMEQVEDNLGEVGLSYEDLPDKRWRDWFDDGYTPDMAVKKALEEESYGE